MLNASQLFLLFAAPQFILAGKKNKGPRSTDEVSVVSTLEPTLNAAPSLTILDTGEGSNSELSGQITPLELQDGCAQHDDLSCLSRILSDDSPDFRKEKSAQGDVLEEVDLDSPIERNLSPENILLEWARAGDDNEWEAITPRPSAEELALAEELEFDYVSEEEGLDELGRRQRSLVPPIKQGVGAAVSVAAETVAETNKLVQPVASTVGKSLLSGARYVGQILHDTGLDTLDSVNAIPWTDLSYSALEGGKAALTVAGFAAYLAAKGFAATPLGQRIIGGIDNAATVAQLRATQAVGNLLRGARDRLDTAVEVLDGQQMKLHERLNPYGLARGVIVDMDDVYDLQPYTDWPEESDEEEEEEA